jgi:poly(3-hydroxybutyrate) depolymerase
MRLRFTLLSLLIACGAPATTADDGGASDGSSSGDSPSADGQSGGDASPSADGGDAGSPGNDAGSVTPPLGGSSGGSGGAAPVNGMTMQASGITYRLVVPSSPAKPVPLLVVYSGTEGGQTMTQNLIGAGPSTGTDKFIRAVLDGVTYNGNGAAGATVLDDVRAKYDVDNDRTYLLGESAGTSAALKLGFHLRQSYFGAYWANDVNANDTPGQTAAQLGFAPWGQVGPGGDFGDANAIVNAMKAAGYRTPNPAPYNGPGAGTHGDPNQFLAALQFFPQKTRQ